MSVIVATFVTWEIIVLQEIWENYLEAKLKWLDGSWEFYIMTNEVK